MVNCIGENDADRSRSRSDPLNQPSTVQYKLSQSPDILLSFRFICNQSDTAGSGVSSPADNASHPTVGNEINGRDCRGLSGAHSPDNRRAARRVLFEAEGAIGLAAPAAPVVETADSGAIISLSEVSTWVSCRRLLDRMGAGDMRVVDSPVPRGEWEICGNISGC